MATCWGVNKQSIVGYMYKNFTQTNYVVNTPYIAEVDRYTTFAIHDSQDDCDDSTQLDSYFLGAQKRFDSRFQIILAFRSTIQLMILSELWQTGADSTQFNLFMSFNAKCCK